MLLSSQGTLIKTVCFFACAALPCAGGAWQTTLEKHPLPEPDGTLGPQPMYTMLLQVPLDVSGLAAVLGFGFLAVRVSGFFAAFSGFFGGRQTGAWVCVNEAQNDGKKQSLIV